MINYIDPYYQTCLNCPVEGGCVYDRDVPKKLCPIESGEAVPQPQEIDEGYMSVRDAAEYIGVTETTVRAWVVDGAIPSVRLGVYHSPALIHVKYAQYAKEMVEDGIQFER